MKSQTKAIFYMLFSAFSFTVMNVFVRLSGDIPSIQKTFFRNLISILFALFILYGEKTPLRVDKSEWKHLFARSTFGILGVICNFYAVDHLLLSDATMLNKMSPFFVVLFSFFLLKERVKLPQALLILFAFGGTLLVLKPSIITLASPASLIALLGGLLAGLAYTEVRILGQRHVNEAVIIFVFSLFSCVVTLPFLLFDYHPMTTHQLLLLLCAGLAATGGQFGVTAAYCCAPASRISIVDYSQIIFSAILGYFCFHEVADGLSFLGYAVICVSAVAMAFYNKKSDARLNTPQQ